MYIGVRPEEDPKAVEAELSRILRSQLFVRAERQRRFLKFIVAETLAGRGSRISGYTVGVEVFDRDENFDPTFDPIVRVGAARLRAKLREYYDSEGVSNPMRIALIKGSYAAKISSRHSAEPAAPSSPPQSGPGIKREQASPSLLVLPFPTVGDPCGHDRFAAGLTEDLITDLSSIPGLSLVSRQASYKCGARGLRGLRASKLSVDLALEGSVRFMGEAVRVSVQLVDVPSSLAIWGARYDLKLKEEFAAQDKLTDIVVRAVELELIQRGHLQSSQPLSGAPRVRDQSKQADTDSRSTMAVDPAIQLSGK
jgi:TolB-like protein